MSDITIHFLHYPNQETAEYKWEVRKQRINFNNLFVIMTDRDGCTYELIKRFDNLDYKNKVILTHLPFHDVRSSIYIPGFENESYVGNLNEFDTFLGQRIYERKFNYIKWLNTATNANNS